MVVNISQNNWLLLAVYIIFSSNVHARGTIDFRKNNQIKERYYGFYKPFTSTKADSCYLVNSLFSVVRDNQEKLPKHLKLQYDSYTHKHEKNFYLYSVMLADLMQHYHPNINNNICFRAFEIKSFENKPPPPMFVFYYPNNSFMKLKNRDFSISDKSKLDSIKSNKSGKYTLPHPLLETFKSIKVGKLDNNGNFTENRQKTQQYMSFLETFTLPVMKFDDTLVEDAYQARSDKIMLAERKNQRLQKLAKLEAKLDKLKAQRRNQLQVSSQATVKRVVPHNGFSTVICSDDSFGNVSFRSGGIICAVNAQRNINNCQHQSRWSMSAAIKNVCN